MPSDTPPDEPLLEVAQITKPHGLRGELVVRLWSDRPERLDPGSVLMSDRGPLTVRSSRPHQGQYLVVFEGVEDRPAADALRGVMLRAAAIKDPDTWWVHELVGTPVVTLEGATIGTVASVEANPASDLLVLEDGGLIPLRFVVEHRRGEQLTVDLPEGLLD
jgi:16S rRNA processing protein RimM